MDLTHKICSQKTNKILSIGLGGIRLLFFLPQILWSKCGSKLNLILLRVCLFFPQHTTSALPGVFSGWGHQIADQKVPNFILKCQKFNFGNHHYGDELTTSENTAKWRRIYNISKAPPLCEKWNQNIEKFRKIQVLKWAKGI